MDPLPWMTLVFLLSACSSLAVNQNRLRSIVSGIRKEYEIRGQFSLAANIPANLDPNDLHTFLQNDDRTKENVANTLNRGEVYKGNNVVIAKPKKEYVGSRYAGDFHAEYRVLTNLEGLSPKAEGDLLLIYSYLSPCDEKCTDLDSPFNIIDIIKEVIPKWQNNVAFVFKKVFDKPKSGGGPDLTALRQSLERLGDSGIGLQNIFRCDYIGGNSQCLSCSSQGSVSEVCVDNNFVPGQVASSSRIRDRSSSRDRTSRDRTSRDRASRDRTSRDRTSKDRTSRDRTSKDRTSRDRTSRDRTSRDRTSRDRTSRDRTSRDRSRSSISRGPRRNRGSTKRGSRSRMSRLDEFWVLI